MSRGLTLLKTAAFGLLAAGLCLTGTGAARAQAPPPARPAAQPASQASRLVGVWKATKQYEGRPMRYYINFRADGTCTMVLTDLQDKPVKAPAQGTYTYVDDFLIMHFGGKPAACPIDPATSTADGSGRLLSWKDNDGDTWVRTQVQ